MGFVASVTGPWGLLPAALPLAWIVMARLGALAFGDASAGDRAIGGATLTLGAFVAGLRLMGIASALAPAPMLAVLAALACGLVAFRPRLRLSLSWRSAATADSAGPLMVCATALIIVIVAARWLPVWQWDALGYHLPFVQFVLQAASLDGLPRDVPYLSTYPHDIELCFVAFRAMLPDDRLVELGHVPFGLLGAAAAAALARRAGARADHAAIAGALWLTLPAVFLQLPTNYIDVASAALLLLAVYWVLAEPTPRGMACAGVALGLYLGSKPNAPPATALLLALLAWRATRAGTWLGWLCVAVVLTFAFGAESYVDNLIRHHNPIWPIRLPMWPIRVGPDVWTLPGKNWIGQLLAAGAAAPRVHGPLPWRILVSWTSLDAPPVFDMRFGGLGPVFLVALAAALFRVVRDRSWTYFVVALATLASPDPAEARYVLAFPALVLALSASSRELLKRKARAAAVEVLTACAAWNVVYATPGLAGDGPPLAEYAHMPDVQRVRAGGADGPPTRIVDARERLRPGQAAAYDATFDLPYLAWTPDLSTRVVRIPDDATPREVARLVHEEDVHLLLVGDDEAAGIWARTRPTPFVPLFALPGCKIGRCTAYFLP